MGREGPIIIGAVIAVVIAIIALIATSLHKLDSDEVGIRYNKISKKLGSEPAYEGLHNGPPGFTFIVFPSVFQTLDYYRLTCLNKDGVEIDLSISYQYRVRGNYLKTLITQFKDHETFEIILSKIGESAIHEACAKFNTSQFQSERGEFQENLRRRLVSRYDEVYTDVTDLQVNNIDRPYLYENAVRSKETAREDIEVARNERPRQLTEATTLKLQAETSATITLDKAQSDARIMLTRAQSEAEAIINNYETEAESYASVVSADGLNLSGEGFLAYMGVRVIEESHRDVNIAIDAPAKTAWLGTS